MMRLIDDIKDLSLQRVLQLVSFVALVFITGCASDRILTTVRVKDYGDEVTTHFRYRLFNRPDLEPLFEKLQPNVFSDSEGAIPVKLNDKGVLFGKMEVGYSPDVNLFSEMVYMFSFGALPVLASHNAERCAVIERVGPVQVDKKVEIDSDYRMALTITSPLGLIYLDENGSMPAENGCRVFKMSGSVFSLIRDACNDNVRKAMVYGVASRLKEMEDSGVVDVDFVKRMDEKAAAERARRSRLIEEMSSKERRNRIDSELRTREEAEDKKIAIAQEKTRREIEMTRDSDKSPYRITTLRREEDSDFAYVFALELKGEPSIRTFFALQGIFAQEVSDAYKIEHPNVDFSKLRVVVKPRLDNGLIMGRAEVLTIDPLSLSYDASLRRGKLSLKFDPRQEEEARNWARENIKTLVRDKNIALITGQLPPEATCDSLVITINDNIMEIEFTCK